MSTSWTMSTSRRALLSLLSATVVCAAIIGTASAKDNGAGRGDGRGGGRGDTHGVLELETIPVTTAVSGTNSMQVRTFKSFQGEACRLDYKRLCPMTPIGKCDLESMNEQLSPGCKAFVEKYR
jgi:hypothetical protein